MISLNRAWSMHPDRGDPRRCHTLPRAGWKWAHFGQKPQRPKAVEPDSCCCTWGRRSSYSRKPELRIDGRILCKCIRKSAFSAPQVAAEKPGRMYKQVLVLLQSRPDSRKLPAMIMSMVPKFELPNSSYKKRLTPARRFFLSLD